MAWREASTVILTALGKGSKFDYKIMGLRRSESNSFFPMGFVFPGGVVHTTDSNPKWCQFFADHHLGEEKLDELTLDYKKLPPMFQLKSDNLLSPQLSLRITAIRETFEESGVLLCRQRGDPPDGFWANAYSSSELKFWRAKVQQNGDAFYDMCLELDVYPDIWGLHLWSNWLTPSVGRMKRYDTSFFVASLKNIPNATVDAVEINKLHWDSPDNFLEGYTKKELFLPPPQYYEMCRLIHFQKVEQLLLFAKNRKHKGCNRLLPVAYPSPLGLLALLPGDEQYPICVDPYDVNLFKDTSLELIVSKPTVMHRMLSTPEGKSYILLKNFHPSDGHIIPKLSNEFRVVSSLNSAL